MRRRRMRNNSVRLKDTCYVTPKRYWEDGTTPAGLGEARRPVESDASASDDWGYSGNTACRCVDHR
eukprot:9245413-Pyramimonas_sp.AAC.1